MTSALKIVLTVITALLIVASLMLVGNTIRLSIYTRRREVEVMRLVGATRWFIRWPFMIEGVVVGFAGGLVAILILWLGKITIVDPLSNTFGFLAAQNTSTLSFPALVAILFAAVGAGLGGRLRRHPAPLPEGLRLGRERRRARWPSRLRCSPCSPPGSGSAGTRRKLPPPLRDVFVDESGGLTAEATELIEDNYYRPVSERELIDSSLQGMVARPAAPLPRPLLRILLAASADALQRRDRGPLLRRRPQRQPRSSAGLRVEERLQGLAGRSAPGSRPAT